MAGAKFIADVTTAKLTKYDLNLYLKNLNLNKEPRNGNTPGCIKPRSESTPTNPISTISNLHELRNDDEDSTPQHMTSVTGHPKNQLYIDRGASLHILFKKELMGELHNTDKPLKIQTGGKPFHIKQIGSLHQVLSDLDPRQCEKRECVARENKIHNLTINTPKNSHNYNGKFNDDE